MADNLGDVLEISIYRMPGRDDLGVSSNAAAGDAGHNGIDRYHRRVLFHYLFGLSGCKRFAVCNAVSNYDSIPDDSVGFIPGEPHHAADVRVREGGETMTDWTPIIIAAIGVLGTGGLWQYMQTKAKLSAEAKTAESADKAEFRESLKAQVDDLKKENKELREKVEQLLKEMAEVKMKLAASETRTAHLEEMLRNK